MSHDARQYSIHLQSVFFILLESFPGHGKLNCDGKKALVAFALKVSMLYDTTASLLVQEEYGLELGLLLFQCAFPSNQPMIMLNCGPLDE